MPRIHSKEFPWYAQADRNRREHVLKAAKLMMNAAHSAPITGGVDHLEMELIWGQEEMEEVADKIDELSYRDEHKRVDEMFRTEAQMTRESDCILAIGSFRARTHPFDVDCGFCGGPEGCGFVYSRRKTAAGKIDPTDRHLNKTPIQGPQCTMYIHNTGYAVGSALWMAKTLLVDARPFMTVGMAANKLGHCRKSSFVVGILVAATAKNPLVDVPYHYHVVNIRNVVESVQQSFVVPRQFGLDYRMHPLKKVKKKNDSE